MGKLRRWEEQINKIDEKIRLIEDEILSPLHNYPPDSKQYHEYKKILLGNFVKKTRKLRQQKEELVDRIKKLQHRSKGRPRQKRLRVEQGRCNGERNVYS